MTFAHLRANGSHLSVGVNLGDLRHITSRTGLDHVEYVDIRFQRALLQTTRDVLRDIVQQGQETLSGRPVSPDCSGHVWGGEPE